MKIKTVTFSGSSTSYAQCPQVEMPEMALMGRSNVGKSSLINMLLGCKQLAKISSRPGKTQLINHFLVNDTWYLVDLPGYGWAQVCKAKRQQWAKMVKTYLLHRQQIRCILLLVDARHEPQKLDIAMINWLGENHIPFVILLTKADKNSKQQVHKNLTTLKHVLSSDWEILPPLFVTSSRDSTGREEILHCIEDALDKLST